MLIYLPLEQELKTGVNENSVLSVFHPDAVDLFSVTSSLDKVITPLLTLFRVFTRFSARE